MIYCYQYLLIARGRHALFLMISLHYFLLEPWRLYRLQWKSKLHGGLSLVHTADTHRSSFRRTFSSQVIRAASVSCCELDPRHDDPSGLVSEILIQFDKTVAILSKKIYRKHFFLLFVYRPRFCPCSDTTNQFFSGKKVPRFCNYPKISHFYWVLNSLSITLNCSSFYQFIEPSGDPLVGIWPSSRFSLLSVLR